jgi:hypothetical protein
MIESRTIKQWRALAPTEKRRRQRELIPRKVARSMAFEGEPVTEAWVTEAWVEAQRKRLATPPDISRPPEGT